MAPDLGDAPPNVRGHGAGGSPRVDIAEGQETDAVHLGRSGLGIIHARADDRVAGYDPERL